MSLYTLHRGYFPSVNDRCSIEGVNPYRKKVHPSYERPIDITASDWLTVKTCESPWHWLTFFAGDSCRVTRRSGFNQEREWNFKDTREQMRNTVTWVGDEKRERIKDCASDSLNRLFYTGGINPGNERIIWHVVHAHSSQEGLKQDIFCFVLSRGANLNLLSRAKMNTDLCAVSRDMGPFSPPS